MESSMAKSRTPIRKKLPSLCRVKQTEWWYSDIPDPSSQRGRRRHYWSKDKAEAKRLYNDQVEAIVVEFGSRPDKSMGHQDASTWALTDLADHYFKQKQADGCGPSTLGNIKKYLPPFMKWLLNRGFDPAVSGAGDLTTVFLGGYRNELAEKTSIGRCEANHYIEQIRGMLMWGRETHDLRPPALGAIRKFSKRAKVDHGRSQDRTPLTWDQFARLLALADPVDTAIILLALNCGFGNTDIGSLLAADVDLKNGRLSGSRHKTAVTREFTLWPETVKALRAYYEEHRGKPKNDAVARLFFIGRQGNPMCWERLDENGKKHRSDAVKNRFDRLCEKAAVTLPWGAGFYIYRHTYSTRIGEESSDPREVQAAMAHTTMRMQEVYRHDRAMKAEAAQTRLRSTMRAKLPKPLLKRLGAGDGEDAA